MERFKNLDRYQKVLFVLLCVMVIVFTLVYAVVSARVGFEFHGSILLPRTVGRDTVYSGTVAAEKITITVTAEKSVTFDCGVKVYGPFTVVEDPTAIPPDENRELYTTGIEVRQGDSAYFRGGVAYLNNNQFLLCNENQNSDDIGIYYQDSNGIKRDLEGNIIDFMKPSVHTILELINGPELVKKGEWSVWFFGVLFAAFAGVSILFADELFLLSLSLRVRNPEYAEPSDWEIVGRYISQTVLSIGSFVLFFVGLL